MKRMYFSLSVFMILLISLSSSVTAVDANVVGLIYPIDDLNDNYRPTPYTDDWSYYVLPAGSQSYGTGGVIYEGSSLTSTSAYYTDVSANGFSSNGYSLSNGNSANVWTLQDDTYFVNSHDFYDDIEYPRAVRIKSIYSPSFELTQRDAISLHMDQSLTFLCDGTTWQEALFNYSEPCYLDIKVHNNKASGTIISPSCNPGVYSFGNPERMMTFPFIPLQDGLQNFWIGTNDTSLITITPHEFSYPKWLPTIEKNELYEGEIDQGNVQKSFNTTNIKTEPNNYLFSIRLFNLSLEVDAYYKIYTLFEMENINNIPGKNPVMFLLGDTFEYISGALGKNGYLLHSL